MCSTSLPIMYSSATSFDSTTADFFPCAGLTGCLSLLFFFQHQHSVSHKFLHNSVTRSSLTPGLKLEKQRISEPGYKFGSQKVEWMNLNSSMGYILLQQTMVSAKHSHLKFVLCHWRYNKNLEFQQICIIIINCSIFDGRDFEDQIKTLTFNSWILNNILKLLASSGVLLY